MLSQAQIAQYDRDGYVLAPGLILEETIAGAEQAMWSVLGMDRDDPALLACFTPAFHDAQSQLDRKCHGSP